MDKIAIGKRIRYERDRIGITQKELGQMVGVLPQTVSMWEQGRTTPDSITLNQLAEIFGVDISLILTDNADYEKRQAEKKQVFNLTKREELLITKLRAMPPDLRQAIDRIIGLKKSE